MNTGLNLKQEKTRTNKTNGRKDMRKTVSKEVTFCDNCKKETDVASCLDCGIEHCNECRKVRGIEYNQAVFGSGPGDGYYCSLCIGTNQTKRSPLHSAYIKIKQLQNEDSAFYADLRKRCTDAEVNLKTIQAKGIR